MQLTTLSAIIPLLALAAPTQASPKYETQVPENMCLYQANTEGDQYHFHIFGLVIADQSVVEAGLNTCGDLQIIMSTELTKNSSHQWKTDADAPAAQLVCVETQLKKAFPAGNNGVPITCRDVKK